MNILIVDDDKLVTTSLKMILETDSSISVLATGNDGKEAITLYEEVKPDVLLMDIRMEHMTGIEAAKKILEKDANARILFLTTFLDDEYIIEALHLGAKGYILKQEYENIIPALKAVYSGQNVFGNEIISKIPDLMNPTTSFSYEQYQISEKEYNIIELIANGLSNKEIAEELYLSEGTVRNYLSIILEKLALRDRTQLAIFYYKHL
ncbi:MAG: response regulator transcription factor [Lachnospiraceae bacterium]|nr:response regulator transcription factor [Lachnospiraceae bacterium]